MIIVCTFIEKNKRTGINEEIVSHGIDYNTGRVIIMEQCPISQIKTVYNKELGEHILQEKKV